MRSQQALIDRVQLTKKVNAPVLLPLVENLLCMERQAMEANHLLSNDIETMKNEINVTELQVLRSLLRRIRDNNLRLEDDLS